MGYKKMKGVNAFKNNFPNAFKNDPPVGDPKGTQSQTEIEYNKPINANTASGRHYQKTASGSKFIYKGTYYADKESWRAAIAKDKGIDYPKNPKTREVSGKVNKDGSIND